MTPGEQYIGVWDYRDHNGKVTETVIAVLPTKELAAAYVQDYILNELRDEWMPAHERSRLFIREVFVRGLVPG